MPGHERPGPVNRLVFFPAADEHGMRLRFAVRMTIAADVTALRVRIKRKD